MIRDLVILVSVFVAGYLFGSRWATNKAVRMIRAAKRIYQDHGWDRNV